MALSDNNSTLLEDLYGQIAPPRYCTADCIDAPRVVSSRRALSGLRLDWAKGGSGPGGGGQGCRPALFELARGEG